MNEIAVPIARTQKKTASSRVIWLRYP
jgi:hypothetical protein